jgi:cytochrome P450
MRDLRVAGGEDFRRPLAASMLDRDPPDHERLRELPGTMVRSLEPVSDPELIAAISAAGREISERIAQLIADKRRAPGDDLITALIQAEDDGDVLSDEELVAQVALLYVAGHETTVNLIVSGSIALMRNPEQFALPAGRTWTPTRWRNCSATTARCSSRGGSPSRPTRWAAG